MTRAKSQNDIRQPTGLMKGSGERFETPCHVSMARGLVRKRASSDFNWSPDLRFFKTEPRNPTKADEPNYDLYASLGEK